MMDDAVGPDVVVARSFSRHGVVYSPGEPPPQGLQADEVQALVESGTLGVVTERGAVERRATFRPQEPGDFLRANDVQVLRRLRAHDPPRAVLRHVLTEAERQRRSPVLLEALRYKLGLSLEAP